MLIQSREVFQGHLPWPKCSDAGPGIEVLLEFTNSISRDAFGGAGRMQAALIRPSVHTQMAALPTHPSDASRQPAR